ncbi:MAG: hypothetical protein JO071_07445 [Deltaproteobacteria bacterium]|nr:hypothetical protein [Deltaproteobacteria bacterium]
MRTRQRFFGIARIILSALMTALCLRCVAGCSGTYSDVLNRSSIAAPGGQSAPAAAESSFAGVWQGTTLASCAALGSLPSRCDALQKVTITLLEGSHAKLSGRYTCAYGNRDCYHGNDTGKVIDVSIAGARMSVRVIMPDATSCIYTGIEVNQSINGGYSCYQGGGLIEQGSWRAHRSF